MSCFSLQIIVVAGEIPRRKDSKFHILRQACEQESSFQDCETAKKGAFKRPLHTQHGPVNVVICQLKSESLMITVNDSALSEVPDQDKECLEHQIRRMLRLSKADQLAVDGFQQIHSAAQAENFGRLLRSPTIWEDLVKCILLCNCGYVSPALLLRRLSVLPRQDERQDEKIRWGRTVAMNEALCKHFGDGAFPTPSKLSSVEPEKLQTSCGVGYRAKSIVSLAQQIEQGAVRLGDLENTELSDDEVYRRLTALPGIGPFSAANMLQLLGRYERIACDSETVRHLKAQHKASQCNSSNCAATASKIYEEYAPYQFLAYWYELWKSYESLLGPFADLEPALYKSFTGSNMRRGTLSPAPSKRQSPPKRKACTEENDVSTVNDRNSKEESGQAPLKLRRSMRLKNCVL